MARTLLLAKSYAVSLLGLAGTIVEVESEISSSLPGFVLVGLPDASLSEAKVSRDIKVGPGIISNKPACKYANGFGNGMTMLFLPPTTPAKFTNSAKV